MYKIEFRDASVTVNTADEMQDVLDYIRKQEADRPKPELPYVDPLTRLIADSQFLNPNPWTPKIFSEFIDSIGKSQKIALSLLVKDGQVSDAELRKAVGAENNQQLAGVLSGLSKQVAKYNLPAREVFTIQNESKSGQTTKHYVIARHLLETARANNWPLD